MRPVPDIRGRGAFVSEPTGDRHARTRDFRRAHRYPAADAPDGPATGRKPDAHVRRVSLLAARSRTHHPPGITGIAIAGESVLAATTESPFFDAHLGSVDDFERNLRGWGEACGADASTVDGLVARMRRTAQ